MPDYSAVSAPFGFVPFGPVLRANWYSLVTSIAVATYHGSVMELVGNTLVTPAMGSLPAAVSEETGAAGSIIGAVIGIMDHTYCPALYIPASAAGNGVIAGYALIADHPDQLYIAAEDGVTSSLVAADMGLAIDAIGTTGSTVTGRSYMMLNSDTMATTATLAFLLIKPHPDDTFATATTAGQYTRFIVKINSSAYGSAVAGI
jgi:hypothetical protein